MSRPRPAVRLLAFVIALAAAACSDASPTSPATRLVPPSLDGGETCRSGFIIVNGAEVCRDTVAHNG